mgnify:CR=1 FL=1|tara:strand:- start:4887 stop:5675 length:789 start_codon:yes stop_codon:yes gene_type:complete
MRQAMSHFTYHPADLEPLNGATRLLDELGCSPCTDLRCASEAFTLLASGADVPERLRRYYGKVGKKLMLTESRLKKYLASTAHEGEKLSWRIRSTFPRNNLTEEDLCKLSKVNTRLQDLEKILQDKIDGMLERMEGLDPDGVEWDSWDGTEIILCLTFNPANERPTYNADTWAEDGHMEPIEVKVKIWCDKRDRTDEEPWGLDDRQNHSDLSGWEGEQMQHFHQCYLFHELWDHADVGTWGMLNLRSIWIEVKPHRSGDFVI